MRSHIPEVKKERMPRGLPYKLNRFVQNPEASQVLSSLGTEEDYIALLEWLSKVLTVNTVRKSQFHVFEKELRDFVLMQVEDHMDFPANVFDFDSVPLGEGSNARRVFTLLYEIAHRRIVGFTFQKFLRFLNKKTTAPLIREQ